MFKTVQSLKTKFQSLKKCQFGSISNKTYANHESQLRYRFRTWPMQKIIDCLKNFSHSLLAAKAATATM